MRWAGASQIDESMMLTKNGLLTFVVLFLLFLLALDGLEGRLAQRLTVER